ncbi:MAG: peroxidase-related enzyme [Spirochaetaceae bacterium]|nr:peroxidase-related enzyme [Spirochaetaceae bacterium]MDT8296781.1 peroxidase-related enzyme [Spirochaetaceae bacterium]
MARIRVINEDEADGELGEIYRELTSSRGRLAEVHKIHSLNPKSLRDHMALYMTAMFSRSPLSRAEREMMAVVVSATNKCRYCVAHHGEALNHFWKNRSRVDSLAQDGYSSAVLTGRESALCRYAQLVTEEPSSPLVDNVLEECRLNGLDDRAILDATLVVSYFNFVNRMVLALGVEAEENVGGYRYDAAE